MPEIVWNAAAMLGWDQRHPEATPCERYKAFLGIGGDWSKAEMDSKYASVMAHVERCDTPEIAPLLQAFKDKLRAARQQFNAVHDEGRSAIGQ